MYCAKGKEGQQFQTDRLPHLPIGLIITPLLEIPLVLYCQQQNSDSFVCIQECKPPSSSETLAPGMLHVGCPLSRAVVSLSMVIYPDVASVMEKAMAPHSSTLAWKITWTEEPGGLQSMGSLRVRHGFTFTFHFHALEKEMATHSSVLAWRIPGRRSLVGCRLWGHTESDTTGATQQQQHS